MKHSTQILVTGLVSICTLMGCVSENMVSADNEELETPSWRHAELVVHSPTSPSFVFIGEPLVLSSDIIGDDGTIIEFDDVIWTSDLEGEIYRGREGEAFLDFGIHTITAWAELPNGDRLQATYGGVRVQSPTTGIYAGSMDITVTGEVQGTPINAACNGAIDFVVDLQGQVLGGEGQCAVNLVVVEGFDLGYEVTGDILEDEVDGQIALSAGPFPIPLDWEGSFDSSGTLSGGFEGQLLTFGLSGELTARRVTRYVE